MAEIAIVTAFFDIGRKKWTGFERDNSKYIEYFKFWARMKNKLIVYTDQKTAQQVVEIRNAYGLENRTHIVIIEDITTLDPLVYQRMERVLSNEITINFRTSPNHPECYNALYDYVMYLKPYFVLDAVTRGLADGLIAWMDFGYNHGGEFYTNPLEFDFLWEYDFLPKIHLFMVDEIDNMPVFEIVRTMKTYISGGIIIAPAHLWSILRDWFQQAVLNLASCGLMDDDQTLLVMIYREHPEVFELHPIENFFCVIRDFGGSHLTAVQLKQYKRTKKMAKKYWQDKQYMEAFQWYWKYAKEKLQSNINNNDGK